MTGPVNSITLLVAPFTPMFLMIVKIMSLGVTPDDGTLPVSSNLIVPGYWNAQTPLRMPTSRSVVPTPAAKAPKAPCVHVWLSPIMTVKPRPDESFLRKESVADAVFAYIEKVLYFIPFRAHFLKTRPCSAVLESFAGVT